ncbi:MAG: hypothetical protein LC734_04580 [Acidobacteria bacterium]|nr:hypothetical protein [Acidobacteriota bacterium]
MKTLTKTALIVLLLFAAGILMQACSANQQILNSARSKDQLTGNTAAPSTAETSTASSLDRDLQSLRNADFNFVLVIRRKDGGVMDADDKRFMNDVTPSEINRRLLSDGGRAIVIGTNFRFPPDTRKVIAERFSVEDYSGREDAMANPNSTADPAR